MVDTVGFNDKKWLDFYGYPHSEDMHLVERYQRVNATTLNLNFTSKTQGIHKTVGERHENL